jgi:hypothetical protein
MPDSHQIYSEDGLATIRPFIAVCAAHCKSHYIISAGRVEWLPAFTEAYAKADMVSVRIGPDLRFAVVGTKPYFAKYGIPKTPQDLVGHSFINLRLAAHGGTVGVRV